MEIEIANDNKPNTKAIIQPLQGIRVLAALGIFFFHATRNWPGPWGVSVFFCLSGFVMMYSYSDRTLVTDACSAGRFTFRKIKKLYPLHLVMLCWAAIRLFIQRESIRTLLLKLIITVPLIQTWSPVGYQALNSVAWYLSVCVFLYFVFPFILRHLKTKRSETVIVIRILAIAVLQVFLGFVVNRLSFVDDKWMLYCFPPFRFGDFYIGCNIALIFLKRERPIAVESNRFIATLIEIAALGINVAFCLLYYRINKQYTWITYTSLFIPTTILLVFVFAKGNGLISTLLSKKLFLHLASISPFFFLIHRQVIYTVNDAMAFLCKSKPSPIGPIILSLGISYFLARIYKRLLENHEKRKQQNET